MPATAPWYQGAQVPLAWTSTDTSGNPREAATAVVTVFAPDGTSSTPTVTHNGSGSYSATYTTSQTGHHVVAWTAADTGFSDAFADSFEVQAAADPTIVSLADAKQILNLTNTVEFDLELQGWNQDATEVAEYICGPVVTRQVTEVVRAQGRVLVLSYAPVRTDLGTTLSNANRRDGSTTNGLVSITPLMTYGFMYPVDELLVDGPRGIVRHYAGLPFFYSGDPFSQFLVDYWVGRKIINRAIYDGSKMILEHLYQVRRGGAGAQDVAAGESVTTLPGFGFAVPNRALELFNTASGSASRAAFA
jgi:hypothetical protein